MTTSNSNKMILTLSMTVIALSLTACGAKQSSETEFASRATTTEISGSTKNLLAYCNKGSGTTFTAQTKAWIENNQVTRVDFIKGRLTLPETFLTNGNYIQMFRWKANSSGQTYLDSNPVQFRVMNNSNYALTPYISAMSWNTVSSAAGSIKATTAASFFSQTQLAIDLKDPYAEFDVLKVVVYNSSNQPVDQVDLLIPVFSANPANYAVESTGAARPTILRNLHPLKGMTGQNWSAEHYQTITNGYCF